MGVNFSTTCNASSSDSKKNGMLRTLKDSSISPGSPNTAACGLPALSRLASDPSSLTEPASTRSCTRPSVSRCHWAAICFSALSQTELAGRIDPSWIRVAR